MFVVFILDLTNSSKALFRTRGVCINLVIQD